MNTPPLILLVDEEKDFLDIFSLKLKASGFDVVLAPSGKEALLKLKEIKPDLILLDIEMPEMNGFETFTQIKSDKATAKIKVVFLTNYGEPLPVQKIRALDEKFAKEIGALSYIRKTDNLDDIVKRVKELVQPEPAHS